MLALVTGDTLEMLAVLQGMNQRGRAQCVLPKIGELRDIPVNGRECVLLITGSGACNACTALTVLLTRYPRLEGVLSFGLAGTFADIPPGTIVRTSTALCDAKPYQEALNSEGTEAPVLKLAYGPAHLGLDPFSEDYRDVTTLTIDQDLDKSEKLQQLGAYYHADIESTEAYVLAHLCNQYSVPLLDMRVSCCNAGLRTAQYNVFSREFTRLGSLARRLFLTPARW